MTRRFTASLLLLVGLLALAVGGCAYAVAAMMSRVTETHGGTAAPHHATSATGAAAPRTAAASPRAASAPRVLGDTGTPFGRGGRPGFTTVDDTVLPGSSVVNGEPSLLVGSGGQVVVTGPSGIGHASSVSASPAWLSGDGGKTFRGPVATETGSQTITGIGGGDSDIIADKQGNLYVTNLWLGNTTMAVSTDSGSTWTELPIGHLSPADDRPWLAYDSASDAFYMAWDGFDGIHVGKALLRTATAGTAASPPSALVFVQDVVAVPEVITSGTAAGSVARECVCPPGTIAVDPQGGVHVAFSSQFGIGIASSSDGGLTWSNAYVPDSGDGKAQDLANNFQVLRSDSAGNLYVVWSMAGGRGDVVDYSWLRAGTAQWHAPVPVSSTASALFGTLAVVSPGVVDIAYYGSDDYPGDPNAAPLQTRWDVYLAQVRDVFGSAATVTADVVKQVHMGAISTGGITGGADRSLGDFFSLAVDDKGLAGMVTAVGDASTGTTLHYIHQTSALDGRAPLTAGDGEAAAVAGTAPGTGGGGAYPFSYPTPRPQASFLPGPPPAGGTGSAGEQAAGAGTVAGTPAPAPLPNVVALGRPGGGPSPAQPSPPAPIYLPIVLLTAVPAGMGLLLFRLRRR